MGHAQYSLRIVSHLWTREPWNLLAETDEYPARVGKINLLYSIKSIIDV